MDLSHEKGGAAMTFGDICATLTINVGGPITLIFSEKRRANFTPLQLEAVFTPVQAAIPKIHSCI